MEQDLIETKNENLGINDYYKLEYKNQDVKNKPEFKKGYKNAKEYIHKEKLKRSKHDAEKGFDVNYDYRILTIVFCEKCMSYTIFSIMGYSYCYAECNICKDKFCIGCLKEISHTYDEDFNSSICLQGYLKAFYLRIIYRRIGVERTNACFFIMHILFCLFITPLYIGFLSHIIGLFIHPNKNRKKDQNESLIQFIIIYSILEDF